jgi:signal transduction histidine kinase
VTALGRPAPGLELSRHLARAARTLSYLVLGLGLGIADLVLAPAAALAPALAWRLGEDERRQANRLLGAHLPPLARPPGRRGAAFWRLIAMLVLKLPVTLLALAIAAAPAALTVGLAAYGFEGIAGGSGRLVGPWTLGLLTGLAMWVLAAAGAVVSIAVLERLGPILRALSRTLLRSPLDAAGPVRELLAERLGDRSLSVAYWLPEREIFVDERGREVQLPGPGSGRAWTAVEQDGRRVAAILHDPELEASPDLVQAAAAAAALAIDNERLKAALRARVEELSASRLRIVEAADDARRRIERDLHDGAQQQLVSLALDLRMLRARLKDDAGAAAEVDALGAKLAQALAELRELARGIHPAILSDRGLGPAIDALVARAPVAVDSRVEIEERLPAPVEAAAYFVVAEGLTNVVKYAHASHAEVNVRRRDGEVEVVVADDGVGGADMARGTGIRGLAERLGALEGQLALHSPPGGGTTLTARVPCTLAAQVRR